MQSAVTLMNLESRHKDARVASSAAAGRYPAAQNPTILVDCIKRQPTLRVMPP